MSPPHLFTGSEIAGILMRLGFTHVVWMPDSAIGLWEPVLEASPHFQLLRVCREGEAWPLAAGLHLGGRRPLVMMQCTGLFESGDALRNVLFDMRLPILALVGVRSYLAADSADSAKRFTQPILDAWGVDHRLLASEADKPALEEYLRERIASQQAGIAVLAEP